MRGLDRLRAARNGREDEAGDDREDRTNGRENDGRTGTGSDSDVRVLWLTPDKPANVSVGRQRIATHLRERGIEVLVHGTTIETVREALRGSKGFDAVIGTTRAGAIAGALVAAAKNCPFVVDHVDPVRQLEATASRPVAAIVRWLENLAFARAAHALYVYPEERSRVERFASRATRTDLGVEFDRFADPSREAIRGAEARLDEAGVEGRVAIYLGGLEPIYHVRTMLDSARLLDEWTLLVVGAGSLSELVERAAAGSERIVFLGSVPHEEVPGYLHAADVGVCLVDDPYTLKVLEYGASGLPVVQLAGRAEERFGGLVDFCTTDPADVARTIEAAYERSTDGERTDSDRIDDHRTDRSPGSSRERSGRRKPTKTRGNASDRRSRGNRDDRENRYGRDEGGDRNDRDDCDDRADRSERDDRGQEATSLRAFARRYDWARIADDYERVLNEVIGRDGT